MIDFTEVPVRLDSFSVSVVHLQLGFLSNKMINGQMWKYYISFVLGNLLIQTIVFRNVNEYGVTTVYHAKG